MIEGNIDFSSVLRYDFSDDVLGIINMFITIIYLLFYGGVCNKASPYLFVNTRR
jgi:hypothetical protein